MERKLKILKAVLLLRRFNRHQSKEEQIEEAEKYYTDQQIDEWIEDLKNPESMSGFWEDPEYMKPEEMYTPSSSAGDYSPSHPWDAPGMRISDFI